MKNYTKFIPNCFILNQMWSLGFFQAVCMPPIFLDHLHVSSCLMGMPTSQPAPAPNHNECLVGLWVWSGRPTPQPTLMIYNLYTAILYSCVSDIRKKTHQLRLVVDIPIYLQVFFFTSKRWLSRRFPRSKNVGSTSSLPSAGASAFSAAASLPGQWTYMVFGLQM